MARVVNALVTWDDLALMGLTAKGTPPTGLGIANKAEIIAAYYVDESASPFSTYTALRCPPYQTIIAGSPVSLSVTPGCTGGAGTGTVLANNFSGGTGSFEYITISSVSSSDALTKLDNPATRILLSGATEYTFTSLGNATYYVAIMDFGGNKGVSTGAVVNCITTTTTTTTCNPTPDWTVVFGMYNCYGTCNKYYVERDLNPCSPTYLNYRQGGLAEANSTFCYIAGTNCCGQSTAANWVNNGAVFCSGCIAYQPQIDNNPCSSTYNNTRNVNLGATAPCNYDANYSSAVGTLYVCNVVGGGVNSYTVYQNTNACFSGNQFFANGNSYASNPSNSYPDTTQTWVANGANYCSGRDLYQPQIQTNPCAVNYNGVRDQLIEADSNTCAEVYILSNCLDSSTAYSITYVKNTFAVGDRVTSSGVTYVIASLAGTNLAGPLALTSTGQTGCPQFTQFFDRCNGDAPYYINATGLSGLGVSSEVSGGCLEVQGVTASPTGTQISDWTSNPSCECI